jgi:hypothetical protein
MLIGRTTYATVIDCTQWRDGDKLASGTSPMRPPLSSPAQSPRKKKSEVHKEHRAKKRRSPRPVCERQYMLGGKSSSVYAHAGIVHCSRRRALRLCGKMASEDFGTMPPICVPAAQKAGSADSSIIRYAEIAPPRKAR